MRYASGMVMASGDIHWDLSCPSTEDEEKGLTISILLKRSASLPALSRRQCEHALKELKVILAQNQITWAFAEQRDWYIDLDGVKRYFGEHQLDPSDLGWFTGRCRLDPDIEIEEQRGFDGESSEYRIAARLAITNSAVARQMEETFAGKSVIGPARRIDSEGIQPPPTIGIITALPKEYAAVKALLKNRREWTKAGRGAGRRYLLGYVPASSGGEHSIVLALAGVGNNSASSRATTLLAHFPTIESLITVGIAGGVPHPEKPDEHVRLGDVVVSDDGGVIQYDFVKEEREESVPRHPPRPPSAVLIEGVGLLEADELEGSRPWLAFINEAIGRLGDTWARPPRETDILVASNDPQRTIPHPEDPNRLEDQPRVFRGSVASANRLLKNPLERDRLRERFGVKAVEMEGSGIADASWLAQVGYLVVRGICDYCDQRKGDAWQKYAAVAAAAYTRALLESVPHCESKSRLLDTPRDATTSDSHANLAALEVLVAQAPKLRALDYHDPGFQEWHSAVKLALVRTFGEDSYEVREYSKIAWHTSDEPERADEQHKLYLRCCGSAEGLLRGLLNVDSLSRGVFHEGLEILFAEWGAKDSWIVVTPQVAGSIADDGTLEILAHRDIFGDPIYGEVKSLKVVYSLGGHRGTKAVREDDWLRLP